MAKLTRIELDYNGIGQLMRSEGMANLVGQKAAEITARAGINDYAYDVHCSEQRQNANVYPITAEAWLDSLDGNTLLKALR